MPLERQLNVIIRPQAESAFLIQLDDLGQEMAERLHEVSCLILETSPGNYQAWVALPAEEADQDFARHIRKALGQTPMPAAPCASPGVSISSRSMLPTFPWYGSPTPRPANPSNGPRSKR